MDWSDSALEANNRQLNQIVEAFRNAPSIESHQSGMDDWLLGRLSESRTRWVEAMNNVSLREGVMISHFEMLSDWQWYRRRGGSDKTTIQRYMSNWAEMLAPATPHLAEEFWDSLGGDGLLASNTLSDLSDLSSKDWSHTLAMEEYLRELIDSARNIKILAQKHSEEPLTKMVVQTSPLWKSELASDAIEMSLSDFDFRAKGQDYLKNLSIFSNESLRGEIFQTWMSMTSGTKKKRGRINTWSHGQKTLLRNGFDESSMINMNSSFIANSLGIENVESYRVGEGEDVAGKARVSFPLEPGIAFL